MALSPVTLIFEKARGADNEQQDYSLQQEAAKQILQAVNVKCW